MAENESESKNDETANVLPNMTLSFVRSFKQEKYRFLAKKLRWAN